MKEEKAGWKHKLFLEMTGRNHVSHVKIWKSILAFLRCQKQKVQRIAHRRGPANCPNVPG